jgi:hypothetical protein
LAENPKSNLRFWPTPAYRDRQKTAKSSCPLSKNILDDPACGIYAAQRAFNYLAYQIIKPIDFVSMKASL